MEQEDQPVHDIGVAIVAPSGYAPDEAALARGIAVLEKQGCRIKNYYDPRAKYQRFGSTDEMRVAQLHAAAVDSDVKIVMMLRGGYGLSRLLPAIDFQGLATSGKLFVGHSDATALHLALLAKTGAVSFAGPMLCDDFTREDLSDFTQRQFWRCMRGPSCTVAGVAQNTPAVDVSGLLWGGNLTMLTHLVGTPYMPRVDGGILFIEDVNEHPYRAERMLLQLLHAGVLAQQRALLLGDFSNYRLSAYDNGYDFSSVLDYLGAQLSIPVLTGLPFGHGRDKATLAVGSWAHLTGDGAGFELTMDAYPACLP